MFTTSTTLTIKDFSILESLLHAPEAFPGATMLIRRKLAEAIVVFPQDMPCDVVTLNSRVRYRINQSQAEERALVFGASEEIAGLTLRLATPRGIGLIGTRAGETVTVPRRNGSIEMLRIEAVAYQPEAVSGRERSPETGHPPDREKVELLSVHRLRRLVPAGDPGDDPGPSAA